MPTLGILSFFLAHQVTWRKPQFLENILQLFCARRGFKILNDDRRDAVFPQQLKSLTRFGTFRIVINGYGHDLII